MSVLTWSRSRTWRTAVSLLAAVAVGVMVWFAAMEFAAGSCPARDMLRVTSSCRVLVASLAARVGAAAGAVVLLMGLVSTGLRRTAEAMEEDRRAAVCERSAKRGTG